MERKMIMKEEEDGKQLIMKEEEDGKANDNERRRRWKGKW